MKTQSRSCLTLVVLATAFSACGAPPDEETRTATPTDEGSAALTTNHGASQEQSYRWDEAYNTGELYTLLKDGNIVATFDSHFCYLTKVWGEFRGYDQQ